MRVEEETRCSVLLLARRCLRRCGRRPFRLALLDACPPEFGRHQHQETLYVLSSMTGKVLCLARRWERGEQADV
jgi:hypothetical protein